MAGNILQEGLNLCSKGLWLLSKSEMVVEDLALIRGCQITPTTRKDVTPLNRKPGGLMEQTNASLQRGDQG